MTPKNRVIIDTDPGTTSHARQTYEFILANDPTAGTDDVLAMLLAFAAPAEDLEVLLLSITYGNIGLSQ